MVDFHTHILPQVDDGSQSVQQSVQMLRREKEQGVQCVVLTPHFYPRKDQLESFLNKRAEAFAKLRAAVHQESLLPLRLGAEVYYYPGMSDWTALKELTVADTEYILIEMPFTSWTKEMYGELRGIYEKQGLIPVLAHIERYITPFNAAKVMKQLAELPVLVQANAAFFTGFFTARLAKRLLKENKIHLLGSDCHDMTGRPPCLGKVWQAMDSAERQWIEEMEKKIFSEQVITGSEKDDVLKF